MWHIKCGCRAPIYIKTQQPRLTVARHDDIKDLRCMSFTSKGTNEILVAGHQETMLVIDLTKGDIVKQV